MNEKRTNKQTNKNEIMKHYFSKYQISTMHHFLDKIYLSAILNFPCTQSS